MTQPKILVIDDDRKFLKIIGDALGPRGYEVLSAANAETGLKLFEEKRPDLVLLDALVPQLDGFKICEKLRNTTHGKNLPVIMMTAIYKMPEKEREARTRLKVKEYMTKPIDLGQLLTAIEKYTAPKTAV